LIKKKEFDSATHFMNQEIIREQEEQKIVDSIILNDMLLQQQAKYLENQGHQKQIIAGHLMQSPTEKKIWDSADYFKMQAEQEKLREQLEIEARERLRMMQEAKSNSPSTAATKAGLPLKVHVNSGG
jgi:hypothetical protein